MYWVLAAVILFLIVAKMLRLKVFHLEWGLVRLEFEPDSNHPRVPLEPRKARKELSR
jgi:hypothetical protein